MPVPRGPWGGGAEEAELATNVTTSAATSGRRPSRAHVLLLLVDILLRARAVIAAPRRRSTGSCNRPEASCPGSAAARTPGRSDSDGSGRRAGHSGRTREPP